MGDIVGALTQVKHLLKPDGVFVGAVLGGDSLFELRYVPATRFKIDIADGRTSIQLAEQERRGGIANRVSPMISMSTLHQFNLLLFLAFKGKPRRTRGRKADDRPHGRTLPSK